MHIGGNAYDHYDEAGMLVHKYGPHIFHTNSADVFDYLSRFTAWRPYQHRVRAWVDGQLVPDADQSRHGQHALRAEPDVVRARGSSSPRSPKPAARSRTSEDVIVSKVGRELYEKFFRNYTRKQWGLDPSELDAAVTARVPVRTNRDDRYFTDTYQAMPLHGYTRMFERMLAHPNIKIMLNTDYREIASAIPYGEMIYTGPIDEFFDYRFGKLPYRSLEFQFETHRSTGLPGRAGHQLSERESVHAVHGVQVPDRAGASEDERRLRISEGGRRSLLPGAAARERRALPRSIRRSPSARRTSISAAGSAPTSTTTWTRSSRRR